MNETETETEQKETAVDVSLTSDECNMVIQCIDGAMRQGINGLAGATALISLADKLARHVKNPEVAAD